jgi:hypothetical protein
LSIQVDGSKVTITGQLADLRELTNKPKVIGSLSIKLVQNGTDYGFEISRSGKVIEFLRFDRTTKIDGFTIVHRSRAPRERIDYERDRIPRS